jgi:hypothetical protein
MSSDKAADGGDNVGGSSILLNQPIVLDNGTFAVKAGFAGGSKPKVRENCRESCYCATKVIISDLFSLHCPLQ